MNQQYYRTTANDGKRIKDADNSEQANDGKADINKLASKATDDGRRGDKADKNQLARDRRPTLIIPDAIINNDDDDVLKER